MRNFETGATRDTVEGKLSYIKGLDPAVMKRYLQYLDSHRKQADGSMRAFDNWKNGIPKDAYLDGLGRHFWDVWLLYNGYTAEDNHGPVILENALCAIMFNTMGYLFEELKPVEDSKPVEDDKPEEFEEFTINRQHSPRFKREGDWFVQDTGDKYLHSDLVLRKNMKPVSTGYFKTTEHARQTIRAYKAKPVLEIKEMVKVPRMNRTCDWWIHHVEDDKILHSDLVLRKNSVPLSTGYYPTKEIAEAYAKAYEEKAKE